MPSVNSSSRPNVWPSSTFTTPSLPTFSIASERTSPISRSRDELCALVLEDVLDLDLTRDRDAVVRNRGGAELLVEHDVAPLRAKGDLDRVGEDVDATLERAPRILVELQLLVSHVLSLPPCLA